MVDPTKIVRHLGERAPIPVEVVPFARATVAKRLTAAGFSVERRIGTGGRPYLTDNGNELLDARPARPLEDPRATAETIRAHTGVVEVGLFVDLATRVVVGFPDGRVDERRRPT
jgi:ribose 5-phosphate isomerase A